MTSKKEILYEEQANKNYIIYEESMYTNKKLKFNIKRFISNTIFILIVKNIASKEAMLYEGKTNNIIYKDNMSIITSKQIKIQHEKIHSQENYHINCYNETIR